MKRFLVLGLIALLALSLGAPAQARWGTVRFSARVSSGDGAPASEVVVRAGPHERVGFIFVLRRTGRLGRSGPLVVRANGGTQMFDARYLLRVDDAWVPVTHEIKSDGGLYVGSGSHVEALVKLVVVTASPRWGWHYEHTFTVTAGERSTARSAASATVLA